MSLQLFSILNGNYSFTRYVSSQHINMIGYASFTPLSPAIIHYHEEGSYIREGREQYFYQNRLFTIRENELLILKSDKTILHKFHLKNDCDLPIHLHHIHYCKNDQYTLDLWIHSLDEYSTSYRIFGPNKAEHMITTDFQKVS